MCNSRAGARVRALRLQDHRSRRGSGRKFLLLRALRTSGGGHLAPRSGLSQIIAQMSLARSRISRSSRNKSHRAKARIARHPKVRRLQSRWAAAIPDAEWAAYAQALKLAQTTGLQFMLGGGFA